MIRLTSKGRRLEETINDEARTAHLRIAETLGPRRFFQLHSSLEMLTELLSASGFCAQVHAPAVRRRRAFGIGDP